MIEHDEAEPAAKSTTYRGFQLAFALLGVSAACVVVSFASGTIWSCVAAPLASLGGAAAIAVAWRLRPVGGVSRFDLERALLVARAWLIALGVGSLIGGMLLVLVSLSLARQIAKSPVSWANLRGIGMAIEAYCQDRGSYPPTLHHLIEEGIVTPWQCYAPVDPVGEADVLDLGYSSYVYQPGIGQWNAQADVILAYERLPWSVLSTSGTSPVRAYAVLFGDGDVRPLQIQDMQQAVLRDRGKRLELGWPLGP